MLWYFDGVEVSSSGVLEQGPLIGAEHGAGTFEVLAVFSHERLGKQRVKELLDASALPSDVALVRQTLVVEQ